MLLSEAQQEFVAMFIARIPKTDQESTLLRLKGKLALVRRVTDKQLLAEVQSILKNWPSDHQGLIPNIRFGMTVKECADAYHRLIHAPPRPLTRQEQAARDRAVSQPINLSPEEAAKSYKRFADETWRKVREEQKQWERQHPLQAARLRRDASVGFLPDDDLGE